MNIQNVTIPSNLQAAERSAAGPSTSFRSQLARALEGASRAAAAVAPAQPAAGVVAAGLGGISRILDPGPAQVDRGNEDLDTLLTESSSFNARYIELQARMQMESQAFTAVSNIMKARHESAQTALNNIR